MMFPSESIHRKEEGSPSVDEDALGGLGMNGSGELCLTGTGKICRKESGSML